MEILRIKDITEKYKIARTTFYELRKGEDFPPPIALGVGCRAKGYDKDAVEAFFKKRQLKN